MRCLLVHLKLNQVMESDLLEKQEGRKRGAIFKDLVHLAKRVSRRSFHKYLSD